MPRLARLAQGLVVIVSGRAHIRDPRSTDGTLAGIVLVFRDITQQRFMASQQTSDQPQVQQLISTAQREVHRVTQISSLEAALRSNERLAVAGRLSASIAHEIHNPLDTAGNLLFGDVNQHSIPIGFLRRD